MAWCFTFAIAQNAPIAVSMNTTSAKFDNGSDDSKTETTRAITTEIAHINPAPKNSERL